MLESIANVLEDDDLRRRCLRWMAFIGQNVDAWPFGGQLHGQGHWSRTLALALAIGRAEGFSDADLECLAAAAAFHDSRRMDEFLDTGHGRRGADYYAAFCARSGMPFDPRAWLAMAWHDRDDGEGLAAIRTWEAGADLDNGQQATARAEKPDGACAVRSDARAGAADIYRAFKDADALDRLRMGRWALDASYLRLDSSKALMGLAEELVFASMCPGEEELGPDGRARLRPIPSKTPGQTGGDASWDAAVDALAQRPSREPYLVVVDVQNDFVDGALGTAEATAALPAMVEKVESFDGQVVFTKDTHDEHYPSTQEGSRLPVRHCVAGEHGWELAGALAGLQRERDLPVFLKGTFGSAELASCLAAAYARGALASVEIIGLCTDICVVSNALLIKAALPGVPVSVDASCCAGVTPASHEAALATMRSCQIDVR